MTSIDRKPGQRIAELDVLRGVAIAAVVGLHVTWNYLLVAPLDRFEGKAVAALHLLMGFGVPLFVLLSGVGLALRYAEPMTWRSYRDFVSRRASLLLPAYIVWSVATAVGTDPALLWPPGRFASLIFTGGAGPQFYFIPLIFEFYMLWPLLRPFATTARRSLAHAVTVVASGSVLSVAWWKLSSIGLVAGVSLTLPAFFLLYMFAGLALAPHVGRLVVTKPGHSLVAATLVAGSALFLFLGFLDMVDPPYSDLKLEMASTIFRPASMFYAYAAMGLGFLLVFNQRGGLIAAGLGELGRHSYGIFLVHLLLLQIAVNRLLGPPTTEHLSDMWGLLRIVATWGLCLSLSYATVRALSHFTVTQLFVGSNR